MVSANKTILIVDDEPNIHYSFKKIFPQDYTILSAHDGQTGIEKMQQEKPDVIVMDVKMPGMGGLEALTKMKEIDARIPVIMMTAFGTLNTAITAMKNGAFDYMLKPFDVEKMRSVIRKALHNSEQMRRNVSLSTKKESEESGDLIVGSSEAMQEVYKLIGQVASQDVTILIRGESGTGKELVARAIYQHSRRADQPFLEINCAAIPQSLLESELFGHEKGAFTGAVNRHIGKFEQVDGGTLFLDEIGEMPVSTQAKILRVIQQGEFSRVGGKETIKTNVRLIAATNVNIEDAIKTGNFREDLYYRLNVITIQLPPLRDRKHDLIQLVNYFIRKYNEETGKNIQGLTQEAHKKIKEYNWPGNVRELENCIRRSIVLAKGGYIAIEEIELDSSVEDRNVPSVEEDEIALDRIISKIMTGKSNLKLWPTVEKILIAKALQKTGNNQVQAAKLLGIHRNTLRNRIDRYDLDV
ncbi:MAG: sigma-54-dependent Fis family transcriptional regulator [Deferribacteres bacterium]|nr:sigma-54-dependent Fis family transcriptional regulator [candidate division KSB1 bacterium]MCB9502531.1 sigma-54-dependent Fis family transcriptional regulator [Deferribacteres bacterium]